MIGNRLFDRLWASLPPEYKRVERKRNLNARKEKIKVLAGLLTPQECHWAVNTTIMVNQYHRDQDPNGTTAQDIPKIAVAVREEQIGKIPKILDDLRDDLCSPYISISTRLCSTFGDPAVPGVTYRGDERLLWRVFLNDDIEGGEIYFPEREVFIKPTKGMGVVWGTQEAHGIAPVLSDWPMFYIEGIGNDRGVREEWPEPEDLYDEKAIEEAIRALDPSAS